MLKKVRELLQSMPMGIKVIFLVVILCALLFPRYVAVLPTAFLLDALFLLMLVLKKQPASPVGNHNNMFFCCSCSAMSAAGAVEKFVGMLDIHLHHAGFCLR